MKKPPPLRVKEMRASAEAGAIAVRSKLIGGKEALAKLSADETSDLVSDLLSAAQTLHAAAGAGEPDTLRKPPAAPVDGMIVSHGDDPGSALIWLRCGATALHLSIPRSELLKLCTWLMRVETGELPPAGPLN